MERHSPPQRNKMESIESIAQEALGDKAVLDRIQQHLKECALSEAECAECKKYVDYLNRNTPRTAFK